VYQNFLTTDIVYLLIFDSYVTCKKSFPPQIRCFCDILRIRWESARSRTRERALMMMDKLV
jgi:hypothetical protein